MLRDIRYAFRLLRKTPVVVAVAILSLALGIGANTAIFTLIDAVMLKSLPVADPGQLVLFYDGVNTGTYSGNTPPNDEFSYPFWSYLKDRADSFIGICAFRQGVDRVSMHPADAENAGSQERANVHLVSGNFFGVLGVGAAAGRVLARKTMRSARLLQRSSAIVTGAIGSTTTARPSARRSS